MNIIEKHIEQLNAICEKYGVDKLFAFGSVVTERFDLDKSDLDFFVEMTAMPPLERGEKLMDLWTALEKLFGRKVDLLTDQPIKNPYFKKSVEATKRLIYDRQGQEIPV